MSAIAEWLNSSLMKVEHKLFKDVVKVEDVNMNPVGDGQVVMISSLGRVTLSLVKSNGERKKITAIVKLESLTKTGRALAVTWGCFDTEIRMYGDILKSMEKLMTEVGDSNYLWADCYHCGDNKLLFQDLCEENFQIVPSHKYLDFEHVQMVMKAIGKYHALTMIMKERNIFDSSLFKAPYYARKLDFMDGSMINTINSLSATIKDGWGPEWSSVPDRLKKYFEKPGELIYNAWEASRGKWDVLNHGDFSIRNMLFHYPPGSSHPDGIKFVDFQICHYSNLANDLITLLYTSIRPHIREEKMDTFLHTYVESLVSTAKIYGFKGPLPTVRDVRESIRSLTPVLFYQILICMPFYINSDKETVQKKSDELFEKYDIESFGTFQEENPDEKIIYNYNDDELQNILKYELKILMNENVF